MRKKRIRRRRRATARAAAPRRRRRSGNAGGAFKLNAAGLKKLAAPAALAGAGALAARASYGAAGQYMPTADRNAKIGISAAAALLGAMLLKKPSLAIPFAVGALGVVALDLLAPKIATALPPESRTIADAIVGGVGYVPAAPAPVTPPVDLLSLPAASDYIADFPDGMIPDQYGIGGDEYALPDQYGLADTDLIALAPYS